ncbi:hypothetical protein [Enterovirga sp. CN4-39]|uniref:hypothetical protein n=1 Tax=Enterovirga sp. CN4-39 TaxID=3400910 RepID=UPI003C090C5A
MAQNASRRSLLASLATLPVTAAGVIPAVATAAETDGVLLAAIDCFRNAVAAHNAAIAADDDAMERYEAPEFPETLYVRNTDCGLVVPVGYSGRGGERRYFKEVTIEYLRTVPCERVVTHARPATMEDGFTEKEVTSGIDILVRHTREPWPEAQARADEIVSAWDALQAELQRRQDACGLTATHATLETTQLAYANARDVLLETEARTIEGVIAKAAAIMECCYPGADGEIDFASDVEEAFAGPALALTLTRNLHKLTRVA